LRSFSPTFPQLFLTNIGSKNGKPENKIWRFLIMKEITYHKEGDYLIPDLAVKGTNSDYHIGLYGRLKLEYMKKHSLGLYSDLILNGTLPEYLIEIDKTANEKTKSIINEFAKAEKVDENLKQNNQLEWVRCMNNIKNRAEEIVLKELIYC
jgi:hypothetical protein